MQSVTRHHVLRLGSQPWNTAVSFLPLSLEHDLDPKLLAVFIKPRPVFPFPAIDLSGLQLEPTRLVRLRGDQQVLKVLVRGLVHFLLERRHETHTRYDPRCDLLILQLEQQTLLSRHGIPHLGDLVSGTTDLDRVLLHLHAHRTGHEGGFLVLALLLLPRRSAREVGLVFAALRVGQVGAVILVDGQT